MYGQADDSVKDPYNPFVNIETFKSKQPVIYQRYCTQNPNGLANCF